jgi:hypothetical protein
MPFLIGIVLLVLIMALIGFLVHIITTNVPMPKIFQQVIQVGVAIALVVYLLGVATGHFPLPVLPVFGPLR